MRETVDAYKPEITLDGEKVGTYASNNFKGDVYEYKHNNKGVASTTFANMVVQELPPITKPRQRTNLYYIDGKSGAQVEKLGYESYPKTARIGLKNLDNIDAILDWLDGEGDVIFSNEPLKVYRGQIIEQIDVSRLGRSLGRWMR